MTSEKKQDSTLPSLLRWKNINECRIPSPREEAPNNVFKHTLRKRHISVLKTAKTLVGTLAPDLSLPYPTAWLDVIKEKYFIISAMSKIYMTFDFLVPLLLTRFTVAGFSNFRDHEAVNIRIKSSRQIHLDQLKKNIIKSLLRSLNARVIVLAEK